MLSSMNVLNNPTRASEVSVTMASSSGVTAYEPSPSRPGFLRGIRRFPRLVPLGAEPGACLLKMLHTAGVCLMNRLMRIRPRRGDESAAPACRGHMIEQEKLRVRPVALVGLVADGEVVYLAAGLDGM